MFDPTDDRHTESEVDRIVQGDRPAPYGPNPLTRLMNSMLDQKGNVRPNCHCPGCTRLLLPGDGQKATRADVLVIERHASTCEALKREWQGGSP